MNKARRRSCRSSTAWACACSRLGRSAWHADRSARRRVKYDAKASGTILSMYGASYVCRVAGNASLHTGWRPKPVVGWPSDSVTRACFQQLTRSRRIPCKVMHNPHIDVIASEPETSLSSGSVMHSTRLWFDTRAVILRAERANCLDTTCTILCASPACHAMSACRWFSAERERRLLHALKVFARA